MLVLGRKKGDEVEVKFGNTKMIVRVCGIDQNQISLGFIAPQSVKILRRELAIADRRRGS